MVNGHVKRARKIGMSGVEDSKEFALTVSGIARMAAKAAVAEAIALKIPVTYLKGNKVIRKHPGGQVETIAEITKTGKSSVTLKKGSVLHARKK